LRTKRGSKPFDSLELKRDYNALSYENSKLEKKIIELRMLHSTLEQVDSQKEEG